MEFQVHIRGVLVRALMHLKVIHSQVFSLFVNEYIIGSCAQERQVSPWKIQSSISEWIFFSSFSVYSQESSSNLGDCRYNSGLAKLRVGDNGKVVDSFCVLIARSGALALQWLVILCV